MTYPARQISGENPIVANSYPVYTEEIREKKPAEEKVDPLEGIRPEFGKE